MQNNYKNILIVGFGASSLNIKAILSSIVTPKLPFYYLDSLDPNAVSRILSGIELQDTAAFIISKSGNTQETNILFEYLATLSCKKIFILSSKADSQLYNLSRSVKHEWIDYAESEGGRFALLTKPFLDIAEVAGIDTAKLKAASLSTDNGYIKKIADKWIENFKNGKRNWVIINYSTQLHGVLLWIRQIVAESLGKNGFGIMPILAEGTMDQHSQLQLFLDGPDDKFYEIISCDFNNAPEFDKIAQTQIDHSFKVSAMLKEKNRLVTHSHHKKIDEEFIGQTIATYINIVKIVADIMGFDPVSQPAVENMKQKSYEN